MWQYLIFFLYSCKCCFIETNEIISLDYFNHDLVCQELLLVVVLWYSGIDLQLIIREQFKVRNVLTYNVPASKIEFNFWDLYSKSIFFFLLYVVWIGHIQCVILLVYQYQTLVSVRYMRRTTNLRFGEQSGNTQWVFL